MKTMQTHSRVNTWHALGVPKKATPKNIERADSVSITLEDPGAEDALVVAGMALAGGVETTLVAPDRSHLPWFLRNAELSYPGQVHIVESAPKEKADIEPTNPKVYESQKHDTFIGCLMSGLSKEQYAEGRSHLLSIHETLKSELNSEDNFCEGINVGTNDSFGTPKEALVVDLEAIEGSEQCVFYQYDDASRPSGMWVELGAALAMDKSCVLLTPNLKGVPPMIREGMPNLDVIQYGDHEKFHELLENSPQSLMS